KAIGVSNLLPVIEVIAVVVDGRHVESAAFDHFGDGGVVHIGGVFDRVGAGAHRVACTVRTVGVNGNRLAELVGHVYVGFDRGVGVGLESGGVIVGAGAGVHFDDVGTSSDLLAHCFEHFRHAVRSRRAGNRGYRLAGGRLGDIETVAGDKHAR